MPVNVYLLMGDRNTRKSSSVRCLTGLYKKDTRKIELVNKEEIEIFAMLQALQEAKVHPDVFIKLVKKEKYSNVLVPLRIERANRCPAGSEYVKKFLDEGWNVKPIIVLGTDRLPYQLASNIVPEYIKDSADKPNNRNVKKIRSKWGWT
jgi:hypothetical protein